MADGSHIFEFTTRKESTLGLVVAQKGIVLEVVTVVERGAIASWNWMCRMSRSRNNFKVVQPGDLILKINNDSGPNGMLIECARSATLHLTMARGAIASAVWLV